ncbi:MAG: cupredoxin domain-containing protein [Thermoleophilaceae bacterium]
MLKTTALLAAAALGLAACGSSSSSDTSSSGSAAAGGGGGYGSKQATTASSSGSSSSEVEMYDNYFKPKTIAGKPGSTVKIELKNEGKNEHNFKIDSQKQADADVEPGKDATVSVKIPASGSVQFYCEYHKGLGMVGTVKSS